MIPESGFYERIDLEAAAKAWHDEWFVWWNNGQPDWTEPEQAARRMAQLIIEAALVGLGSGNIRPPTDRRLVSEWKPVGESE